MYSWLGLSQAIPELTSTTASLAVVNDSIVKIPNGRPKDGTGDVLGSVGAVGLIWRIKVEHDGPTFSA